MDTRRASRASHKIAAARGVCDSLLHNQKVCFSTHPFLFAKVYAVRRLVLVRICTKMQNISLFCFAPKWARDRSNQHCMRRCSARCACRRDTLASTAPSLAPVSRLPIIAFTHCDPRPRFSFRLHDTARTPLLHKFGRALADATSCAPFRAALWPFPTPVR